MYALAQPGTKEPFTFNGRYVLHHDLAEMRFLFPEATIVQLRGYSIAETAQLYGVPCISLRDHPDMAAVSWPLDRRSFVS